MSSVGMAEDADVYAEPPDPDVLETDPTCRYLRVMLWLHCFLLNKLKKMHFKRMKESFPWQKKKVFFLSTDQLSN